MDEVLPFRLLSPSLATTKPLSRQKFTKLSLKHSKNAKGKAKINDKENTPPSSGGIACSKDQSLDIITSDESGPDESFATVGGCKFPDSTSFSQPVAESTRYELEQPAQNSQVTRVKNCTPQLCPVDSASSNSSSCSGFVTAYPIAEHCNDSIICISDSENESPKRTTSTKYVGTSVQKSIVIISSDESDMSSNSEEGISAKPAPNPVFVGSSDTADSDSSGARRPSFRIPPSVRGSNCSINSNSSPSDENFPSINLQGSFVRSAPSSRSSSIVSNSVKSDKVVFKRHSKGIVRGNDKASQNVGDCDEFPWKENFHLAVQKDSSLGDVNQESTGSGSFAVETPGLKIPSSLTKDKFQDIKRWILKSRSSDDSEANDELTTHQPNLSLRRSCRKSVSSSDEKYSSPCHRKTSCQITPDSVDNKIQNNLKKYDHLSNNSSLSNYSSPRDCFTQDRQPVCYTPSLDESEDKFEAFMNSIKHHRIKKLSERRSSGSFINDDSSVEENCSPSIYHKEIAKSVRTEPKGLGRWKLPSSSEDDCRKKILFSQESDNSDVETKSVSEAGDDDSDWNPKMIKSTRRRCKPVNDNSECGSRTKKVTKPKPGGYRNRGKQGSNGEETSGSADCIQHQPTPTSFQLPPKFPFKKPISAPSLTPQGKAKMNVPVVPYSPIRTFLSSLSGPANASGLRSHPEAEMYYKDFKRKKEELTRRLFKLYNREVFDSRLPQDMSLEWNARMVRTAGFCYCKLVRKSGTTTRSARIALSTKVVDSAERLRDTLIHEMCHAAVWLLNHISGGHGPFWKAWADKARKRFPELPEISRCHDYKIETKYTYRCTDCGYSFGRHSKSLDLEKKRCGYCYGRFEVLLTKNISQERKENVPPKTPKTPKTPSAFALFVKEHYRTVKEENAHFKHGDVMKKLGEKFSSLKIKPST